MRPVTRIARALAAAAVCAVALVGCTGLEPTPGEYGEVNTDNDGYYGNFMFGCTGVEAVDGAYPESLADRESAEFCTCVFEGLKETVPFSEMQELDEAQETAEDGEFELPRNVNAVRQDCADSALG